MSESTHDQRRKNIADIRTKILNTPKMSDDHGFNPKEYNIVIAPSANVEQKSAGGIILTSNTVENENDAVQVGRLIAVSKLAFTYSDKWTEEDYPKLGDLVTYARFAGSIQIGLDGGLYRVCKDQDIMTVYDNEIVEKIIGEQ